MLAPINNCLFVFFSTLNKSLKDLLATLNCSIFDDNNQNIIVAGEDQ